MAPEWPQWSALITGSSTRIEIARHHAAASQEVAAGASELDAQSGVTRARRGGRHSTTPVTQALRIRAPHSADSFPPPSAENREMTPYHDFVLSIHG